MLAYPKCKNLTSKIISSNALYIALNMFLGSVTIGYIEE